MDDSNSSLGSSNEENVVPENRETKKICGVCSDRAKSYHFGGLCCESCKAFFRRAMQNDSFKSFFCVHGQTCVITKENRRSCQKCRIQKCFQIGMDKGWLRTEEENVKMREAKLGNSKPAKAQTTEMTMEENNTPIGATLLVSSVYEPSFEDINVYLSPEDVKFLENIVDDYWKAYRQVPFGTEVTQNSTPRSGLQVISMFTTGIRRWAAFARSLSEFSSLCRQDQANILQAAVMQLSILRAVASFRMSEKEWRINTPVNEFTPSLSLEDVQRLLSPQLAEMHLTFISSMHKFKVDEPTIMLLSLITMFTPDRADLVARESIAKTQEQYILLLERYCNWKYGPADKGRTFANLLAKMSDLRELSDLHSDHQVRFANQDLHKLYQELDAEPRPHVNMDLNNTNHFLSAMEFSILKTHHTLPKPEPVADPTYRELEQIEEMCAVLEDQQNSTADTESQQMETDNPV